MAGADQSTALAAAMKMKHHHFISQIISVENGSTETAILSAKSHRVFQTPVDVN
jgi:hypothetical protein